MKNIIFKSVFKKVVFFAASFSVFYACQTAPTAPAAPAAPAATESSSLPKCKKIRCDLWKYATSDELGKLITQDVACDGTPPDSCHWISPVFEVTPCDP